MKRLVTLFLLLAILLATPLWAAADDGEAETEGLPTYAVKAAWGLRLREKAGLSSDTLMVLDCGELVTVIDGLESATIKNGLRWVEVSVERDGVTTTGFVAFKYLTTDLTPNCYLVSWRTKPPCHHCGPHRPPKHPRHPGGGPPNGDFPGGGATEGEFPGGGATEGEFPGGGATGGDFPGGGATGGEFPGGGATGGEFPGGGSG
ncbi:MAG: hypothetical protein ACOX3S_14505 [Anaerolineae bacterium]